jgi:hypothetical protein
VTAIEFESCLVEWARRQNGLVAVVLGGSRALGGHKVDDFADWDIQLITNSPSAYQHTSWLQEIAPCWCSHADRTPRGVIKVSAVFQGGFEVDFVPLASWQMKLVYSGMRHPNWANWMPARLRRGIYETRGFMLGSGYRLLVGDLAWNERFEALKIKWPDMALSPEEFQRHVAAFWTKAVWVYKKIARAELRSAVHWFHMLIVQHVYVLLAEEARLAGRIPRPEARKAELWLDARRLAQTTVETKTDQKQLAGALITELELFSEITQSVGTQRDFMVPDYSAVQMWIRSELSKIERKALSP